MNGNYPSQRSPYNSKYQKLYRNGLRMTVDATGTIRRLQALQVIGYTQKEMGDAFGICRSNLGHLMHGRRLRAYRVHIFTERKVREFYEAHSHKPVWNTSPVRKKARTFALRYGWAPPMAWDDIDDPNERPRR